MSQHYDYEVVFEEMFESGLGFGVLANLGSFALSVAVYVFTALSLYTIASRRGIRNSWLSWVPGVNVWIVGALSDQYRYVVRGEVKSKRKILLGLKIASLLLGIVMAVFGVITVFNAIGAAMVGTSDAVLETVMGPAMGMIGMGLPLGALAITHAVFYYMAMYDIYTSCTPQNNVMFLVLSIIFRVTEPFFLFFNRDKDEGMPPRRTQPQYEPPREPWNAE